MSVLVMPLSGSDVPLNRHTYPKKRINWTNSEEMLLILHSLQRIIHQTQSVSPFKVYTPFPSTVSVPSVNTQAVEATIECSKKLHYQEVWGALVGHVSRCKWPTAGWTAQTVMSTWLTFRLTKAS